MIVPPAVPASHWVISPFSLPPGEPDPRTLRLVQKGSKTSAYKPFIFNPRFHGIEVVHKVQSLDYRGYPPCGSLIQADLDGE